MTTPLHFTHANPLGVRGQASNPVLSLAERYDQRNGRGKFCRFSACFAYRTPKKSDSVNSVKQEIKSKGKMIIPAVIIVPINNNNLPMPILSAVASFVCPCNCPWAHAQKTNGLLMAYPWPLWCKESNGMIRLAIWWSACDYTIFYGNTRFCAWKMARWGTR